MDHVDVTALLAEMSALRREVRAVTQLKAEIEQLKALLSPSVSSGWQDNSDAFPPITDKPHGKSYAGLAQDLTAAAALLAQSSHHAARRKQT